jgi:hypothetical protein
MGEKRNACRLLVGKPERKRPLGKPRRRSVDNIKMDLGEVWCAVNWVILTQVESSSGCGNEPSGSIKCWDSVEWLYNLWPLE